MPALAASNRRVRELRRLLGRRSARHDAGRFVLEGPTLIADSLSRGVSPETVFVADDAGPDLAEVADAAAAAGSQVHRVAPGVLDGLGEVVTPRPILAVAPLVPASLEAVIARAVERRRHVILLDEVRDPGNLGTIMRAAEASGAAGVVCSPGTVDPWSPKVVRSSAGAVLGVPVVLGEGTLPAVASLQRAGVPTWATVVDGGTPLDEVDPGGPVAFLLGNEAHGLEPDTIAVVGRSVTIPMEGRVESLNVAMAATILCFEAGRRHRGRTESDWTREPPPDKVIGP